MPALVIFWDQEVIKALLNGHDGIHRVATDKARVPFHEVLHPRGQELGSGVWVSGGAENCLEF